MSAAHVDPHVAALRQVIQTLYTAQDRWRAVLGFAIGSARTYRPAWRRTSPHHTVRASRSASRQQADGWLQAFRASPHSWRLCLELLSASGLRDYEQYFSANTLKYCCQKYPVSCCPR
jgi:hypothetical protein